MKRYYIFYLLIVGIVLGCNKTEIDPELVINVDDEFRLDLWEDLESGSPQFNFLLETIKEYDCEDNTIKYTLDGGANTLVIKLDQINQKSDCIPGLAPASANIPLDLEGDTYNILIKLKETIVNEGTLQISPQKFIFKLEDEAVGINLVRDELYRVPKGTIWGFVAYKETEDKSHADQFIADLEALSETSNKSLTKGYYGYFSVLEPQKNTNP